VCVSQVGQSRRPLDAERGSRGGAQFGADERASFIGEADQARVEGRIPERGKEQAVVHVEPLRVDAFGPGHDVGGPQQSGVGNAGDRAAGSPIIHQGGAEDVLADALDDELLDLGRLRQAGGLRAKPAERGVGEADAELVDAVERGMERGQGVQAKGGDAGPGQRRRRQRRRTSKISRRAWNVRSKQ
jgi:hypothetical protein